MSSLVMPLFAGEPRVVHETVFDVLAHPADHGRAQTPLGNQLLRRHKRSTAVKKAEELRKVFDRIDHNGDGPSKKTAPPLLIL